MTGAMPGWLWERGWDLFPGELQAILAGDSEGDWAVAGGVFRSLVEGTAPKDIDIFAKTPLGWDRLVNELQRIGRSLNEPPQASPLDNLGEERPEGVVFTWEVPSVFPIPIQVIYRDSRWGDLWELIRGFDLTITQAAACYGWSHLTGSVVSPTFVQDVRDRVLRFAVNPGRPSVERVVRFFEAGYQTFGPGSSGGQRYKSKLCEEIRALQLQVKTLREEAEVLRASLDTEEKFMERLRLKVAVARLSNIQPEESP